MLLIAIAAINRPGSVRLEWDLGLLAAFGAGNISHFSRSAVVAAFKATTIIVLSLVHLIHLPLSIQRTDCATKETSQQISLNRRRIAASSPCDP
jgi:hypothetical protein